MLKNFTLLYVEDNMYAQKNMQMIFQEDVREFYQAYDGNEGLELYFKYKPDIIITDINMPILDGLAMAKQIKEDNVMQIVVIMSAFDDREVLLQSIDIGVDGFITKPIKVESVYRKLEALAQNLQNKRDLDRARNKEIKHLYNLAHCDQLTNIPNRILLDIRLKQSIHRTQRLENKLALFYLDLDDFKGINDTHGHEVGDQVLKTFVKSVEEVVRLEDTLFRVGGDEFVLIAEDMHTKEDIDSIASKILDSISLIECKKRDIKIACSIGISVFPDDAKEATRLMASADMAMYHIKKSGKSDYAYYDLATNLSQ